MKHLLVVTQLSNYDLAGNFILECDSGWNMCIGRVREMLKLVPDLHVTITGPIIFSTTVDERQVITSPMSIHPELWDKHGPGGDGRLEYVQLHIKPSALASRYDFDWDSMSQALRLNEVKTGQRRHYDAVYVNDPMHLRNLRALFHVECGKLPKFFVHSHFIDNPESPKFPIEASLWHGQCEAAIRADYNFWQCEAAMGVFFESMSKFYRDEIVEGVRRKSSPWDDGYSVEEITTPVNMGNLRFSVDKFAELTKGKSIIFVPNRVGGRGRSSDYTNCGKFMFELLPMLAQKRNDYVVIAGNPNQKFSNEELSRECGKFGYVSLVPDALNRDEFKFVASRSTLAIGLYDQDTYGGTVARELLELGCNPFWLDNYEYASLSRRATQYARKIPWWLTKPDFSSFVYDLSNCIDKFASHPGLHPDVIALRNVVQENCSYEATTPLALKKMGFL